MNPEREIRTDTDTHKLSGVSTYVSITSFVTVIRLHCSLCGSVLFRGTTFV